MSHIETSRPDQLQLARDAALLWRATNLAIESAFRFGRDLPVGAVVAQGDSIVGRYFASDVRGGYPQLHAEYMAVMETLIDPGRPEPDTVVVSTEPCDNCQDFLATVPSVRRVAFGLTREELAARGLVKPHTDNIFARALKVGLPYEVLQVDDPDLQTAGMVILKYVNRDPETQQVTVDKEGLSAALVALNNGVH